MNKETFYHKLIVKHFKVYRDLDVSKDYTNTEVLKVENNYMCGIDKPNIKWHTYCDYLNSSQMLCVNFFWPLKNGKELLLNIMKKFLMFSKDAKIEKMELEYVDKLGDDTNFDNYIKMENGRQIFMEIKYTEPGFGKKSDEEILLPKYQKKWNDIYKLKIKESIIDGVSKEEFYHNYQIYRNLLRIKKGSSDFCFFIVPRNNDLCIQELEVIKQYKGYARIIYWEDLVKVAIYITKGNKLRDYYLDLYSKYFGYPLDILKNELIYDMTDKNAEDVYKNDLLNIDGIDCETNQPHEDYIAMGIMTTDYIDQLNGLQPTGRKITYNYKKSHNGNMDLSSSRKEENIAYGFVNGHDGLLELTHKGALGTFIDYQIPLSREKQEERYGESFGKIDLLSKNNNTFNVIELKVPESRETLLRAVLEVYTYYKLLDKKKLSDDYGEQQLEIQPVVLVGEYYMNKYNKIDYPNLFKMIELLGVQIETYRIKGQ